MKRALSEAGSSVLARLESHCDAGGIFGMNDVADIDITRAGSPIDWRSDLRVAQLDLRHVDLCLVGLDAGFQLRNLGFGRIKLLATARPIEIEPRIIELRLILQLRRLNLRGGGLKRRGVELDQHIAGVNILPFLEGDAENGGVDT
jgi:hypothetical protein